MNGWLLDLYEDPLGGVVLWFLSDDGKRLRLRQRFPVHFYVSGRSDRLRAVAEFVTRLADRLDPPPRAWYEQRMDVFARAEIPVLAVEVDRPAALSHCFWQIRNQFPDLDYANADLQISLRYAAATGVWPLCRCRVEIGAEDTIQAIHSLEGPWTLDPSSIPLKIMTMEPECSPAHRAPRFLIVQAEEKIYHFAFQPERALLVNLQTLLNACDPDLLVTSWGDTWLLPLLLEMAEKYSIPLALNRDGDAVITRRKERWYFSYGQIVYRGEQVHLFGRWHLDRSNALFWEDYGLDGVLEMARVTCLPFQTAARVSPGTGISAIQMLAALRHCILVPWQKQQAEMLKPAADLFAADQGGLVYQPIVGVHRNVAAVDFVSMFPSEMVYFNLSPETIGAQSPSAEQVPGLNLVVDRSRVGIVPLALKPLLDKRVALKRRKAELSRWDPRRASDQRRSSALKWLLVTCFGYLGYKNARFGRIEAHQAVTAYARDALLKAKEAAEEADLEMVHAYIDCLWLKRPDEALPEEESLKRLLAEIENRTGLPIALDGIYRWIVFLPSRVNKNRPVANRYFGVFQDGEIKMRGIAARRRDTPLWVANIQLELIKLLAHSPNPEEALPAAVEYVRKQLAELSAGRVPLDHLLVSQRISREVEDYRSPSPAARAALQLQQIGKRVKPGQRVAFVFTLGKPGVWAWDLARRPDVKTIHVPQYRTLLLRAAEEVLLPLASRQGIAEWIANNRQDKLRDRGNTGQPECIIPHVQRRVLRLS